jgi:hypothetical protein
MRASHAVPPGLLSAMQRWAKTIWSSLNTFTSQRIYYYREDTPSAQTRPQVLRPQSADCGQGGRGRNGLGSPVLLVDSRSPLIPS